MANDKTNAALLKALATVLDNVKWLPRGSDDAPVTPNKGYLDLCLEAQTYLIVNGWLQSVGDKANAKEKDVDKTDAEKLVHAGERRDELEADVFKIGKGRGGGVSVFINELRKAVVVEYGNAFPELLAKEVKEAVHGVHPREAFKVVCDLRCGGDPKQSAALFDVEYPDIEGDARSMAESIATHILKVAKRAARRQAGESTNGKAAISPIATVA